MSAIPRVVVGGVSAGIVWYAALVVFFGPAQRILANPSFQSAKFLAVFSEIEPLPRASVNPWILVGGLLVIGIVYSAAFTVVERALPRRSWLRGMTFGLVAWGLMVPWFEFYLPWNVMHEPLGLVLLEGVLWVLVLQVVGVTIAVVHRALTRPSISHELA